MTLKKCFFVYISFRFNLIDEVFPVMIFEIFLILAALGGVSILFRGKRLSRLLAFFLAAAGAVLLLNFYQNWQLGYTDGFTL